MTNNICGQNFYIQDVLYFLEYEIKFILKFFEKSIWRDLFGKIFMKLNVSVPYGREVLLKMENRIFKI